MEWYCFFIRRWNNEGRDCAVKLAEIQQDERLIPGGGAQERVLAALRSIVSHGPISLAAVTRELRIPRSSSHRAMQALIEFGWVRKRAGDQAYVLSAKFSEQIGQRDFATHTAEAFQELMGDLRDKEYLHSELALPDPAGRLRVIESTWKKSYFRGDAGSIDELMWSPPPEMRAPFQQADDAGDHSRSVPAGENPSGLTVLAPGIHIVGNGVCIPFKTDWLDVGILSIWPVRNFSNSRPQIERIVRHLRNGEVFKAPEKIELFYTGVNQ